MGNKIALADLTKDRKQTWLDQLPRLVRWIFTLASITCLVSAVGAPFGWHLQESWLVAVLYLLWTINIPASSSLVLAALYAIFAAAATRRKRVIVWVLVTLNVLAIPQVLLVILDLTVPTDERFMDNLMRLEFSGSALFGVLAVIVLIRTRRVFPGRVIAGSFRAAATILVTGLLIDTGLGMALINVFPRTTATLTEQFRWVTRHVLGQDFGFFINYPRAAGPSWLATLLSAVATLVLLGSLLVFLRGQRMPGRTRDDDLHLRELLARNENADSLSYFATRNDRSTVFAADGKAAVSYSVLGGVAMAAGDPIGAEGSWRGAIAAWEDQCVRFGWVPAVISATERGARAYREAGLRPRLMGDEAIIETKVFDITQPTMKPLVQAVRRVRRAGVAIVVRTLSDIPEEERRQLARAAEDFREGEERGFSMALDRLLDPVDAKTVVVTATKENDLHCLLTFVPWGRHGLSLNLMRRNPDSVNGIIEAMVVTLVDEARKRRIERFSLNFAMFRQVFEGGTAVDAGLGRRALRQIMLLASKKWQLDSLNESNARYQPTWSPRYLCYPAMTQLTQVLLVAGALEGFLPYPHWMRRIAEAVDWDWDSDYRTQVLEIDQRVLAEQLSVRRIPEQERIRREKAQKLAERGRDPYPPGVSLGTTPGEVRDRFGNLPPDTAPGETVRVGGRIRALRDHGGLLFVDIARSGQSLQLMLEAGRLGGPHAADFADFALLDLGDLLAAEGQIMTTRTGELTVLVDQWQLVTKSLRPLPRMGQRLDAATRARQRTLHLLTDDVAMEMLRMRSRILAAIRTTLYEAGVYEAETPMLQAVQGGANARPFVTHLNAYSTSVFLRIAPELYLKRLMVAGLDSVFEMGRSFRNEGADSTHNPEFTSLEAYISGADYVDTARLTQRIIQRAARAIHGEEKIWRPAGSAGVTGQPVIGSFLGQDICSFDISGDWPIIPVYEAVSQATGTTITPDTPERDLHELCREFGIISAPGADHGSLVTDLYDELVEAHTLGPTFYSDFPLSTSPLSRKHRRDPRIAEKWDLVAFGMELGTASSELADPADQRDRFTEQSLKAAAGDPEAMSLDEDFLESLEFGMPPNSGLGVGVDRLIMLLTGTNIRQTLAFPFVKPN